jgi:hypothetical protein
VAVDLHMHFFLSFFFFFFKVQCFCCWEKNVTICYSAIIIDNPFLGINRLWIHFLNQLKMILGYRFC